MSTTVEMKAPQDLDEIRRRLEKTMLPHELETAFPIIEEIHRLKREKNACILSHNYMTPDIYHGVSDYVGDSLGLSRLAARTDADLILFNGVHFMAETARILNPKKKVLIADLEAGCSLSESITAADVRDLRAEYPGVPVVVYVNCTAAVKAEADMCCTSANAVRVVNSLPGDRVIFLPDKYLAQNVAAQTDKEVISWEKGSCLVHEMFTAEDIQATRRQFDDLLVIAHPECPAAVTAVADFTGSTTQMENKIRESRNKNIMLVTECNMGENLRALFPDRSFVTTCHTCPHMKRITLERVRDALLYEQYVVDVPEEIRLRALRSVENMLSVG